MPSEVVLGSIYATLKTLLSADAQLAGLLATKTLGGTPAIYDEGGVPQGSAMPYLAIGAGTQVEWGTMGAPDQPRYGWNCTLQIKAIGQGNEASGLSILSAVVRVAYNGRPLNLAGYGSSWCDEFNVQPTLVTTVAGVTTREWPGILRVYCHDS